MTYKNILAAALAATLVTASGCTSDFDMPDEGKPVLVVNMLAVTDSLLDVSVTHSWAHSTTTTGGVPRDVTVKDATVKLSVNGAERGLMVYDDKTMKYVSDYRPAAGDRIDIAASSDTYGNASGSTVIPKRVKIDKWSFNPVEITDFNGMVYDDDGLSYLNRLDIQYSITFTDPADEENYYLVSGRPYHETGGGICSDPIISENDTPLDAVFSRGKSFVVFSDRSINGKSYTLRYTCSYIPFIPVTEFAKGRLTDRISFCSISRDYYLYLLSIYKKYGDLNLGLEDMGLSEPKVIYSSVISGTGVVASQSADTICNDVHDIVCKFIGYYPDLGE